MSLRFFFLQWFLWSDLTAPCLSAGVALFIQLPVAIWACNPFQMNTNVMCVCVFLFMSLPFNLLFSFCTTCIWPFVFERSEWCSWPFRKILFSMRRLSTGQSVLLILTDRSLQSLIVDGFYQKAIKPNLKNWILKPADMTVSKIFFCPSWWVYYYIIMI